MFTSLWHSVSSRALPFRFRSSAASFGQGGSALALESPGDEVTVISQVVISFSPMPSPPTDEPPIPPLPRAVSYRTSPQLTTSTSFLLTISEALDSGPTDGVSQESTIVDSRTMTFEFNGSDSPVALFLENCIEVCASGIRLGGIGGRGVRVTVAVVDGRSSG